RRPVRWSPRNTDARRKIVSIGIDKTDGKYTCECRRLPRKCRNDCCEAWSDVQIDDTIVQLARRGNVFVSQTEIQREISSKPPVILHEQIPGRSSKLILAVAVLD